MSITRREEFNLFKALIEKDVLTAMHSMRVALFFKNACLSMGMDISPEKSYLAGLFHDIGKLCADDVIFSSKSPLSPEEYEEVKRHPVDSYRLLKEINMPEEICKIALLHHERGDGSGYPYALVDSQIPDEVKLIAIVDSFCAINEKRAYRQPLNVKDTIKVLLESRQKYNSKLLNRFCRNIIPIYTKTMDEIDELNELYTLVAFKNNIMKNTTTAEVKKIR